MIAVYVDFQESPQRAMVRCLEDYIWAQGRSAGSPVWTRRPGWRHLAVPVGER